MTIYYFDTSAIVKRYRVEKGTPVVDEIINEPLPEEKFYISFLAILEVTSSITRLERNGQLTNNITGEILSRFRRDILDHFRIWPLDDEITNNAVSMVENFGLRAADAIHMATASYIFSATPGSSHIMVSSDRELLQAAKAFNFIAIDPQKILPLIFCANYELEQCGK